MVIVSGKTTILASHPGDIATKEVTITGTTTSGKCTVTPAESSCLTDTRGRPNFWAECLSGKIKIYSELPELHEDTDVIYMVDTDGTGVSGKMVYKGVWDCSGGVYPTGPAQGDYYICSVPGTISGKVYSVGDMLAYNGTGWDKIEGGTETDPIFTAWLSTTPTKTLYVDKNRVDVYTETGSIMLPYKTIQAAVNALAVLDSSIPHTIKIANGHYVENVVLEDARLRHVTLLGEGIVRIAPLSGNSLQSTATNTNLFTLHIQSIIFDRPVALTGSAAGTQFSDVVIELCSFVSNSQITATCMNNLSMFDCYNEKDITMSNVNWFNIVDNLYQGNVSITSDDTADIPSWGLASSGLWNGLYFNGTPSFAVVGTGTVTVGANGCKIGGSGSTVTVPAGVTFIAQNSFLRKDWTITGTLYLRTSFVQGTLSGGGTITIENTGSQIANTPTGGIAATTVQAALNELDGDKMNTWVTVPANASAAGSPGDLAYADGFLYVCIASGNWQRVAIATWP